MGLEWLKEEIGKEVSIISHAFGKAEEKWESEFEVLKGKALQDSKALEQFLKNLAAKEELELNYIKTTLIKETGMLRSKLGTLKKEEKKKVLAEMDKLRSKIKNKKVKQVYKKKAIEEISRLQALLQKTRTGIDKLKKLAKKTKALTEKEEKVLIAKIEDAHKKDMALFYKKVEELNRALQNLKKFEEVEVQIIREELGRDVKKIRKLFNRLKIKNEEYKKLAHEHLKKAEESLKVPKTKEAQLKQAIKQKITSLQKNLDEFIVKEKEQTSDIIQMTLAKLRQAKEKTEEEEKGIKKYVKKLFTKKQEKTEEQMLKDTAMKKLAELERRKLDQKTFDDFTWILKVFLSNYLKINYEYTHEELVNELTKRRVKYKDDIVKLSKEVDEINYEGDSLDKEHFQRMVEEAKKIIKEI